MEVKFNGSITKLVIKAGTKEVIKGVKGIAKNAENIPLILRGLKKVKGLDEIQEIFKEPDKAIRKFNKDLDILQKKIKKAGAQAAQIKKEAEEGVKVGTLVRSNTSFQSDKVVKTKSDGTVVRQYDIWKQDEERIEKSRKLTDEQKEDLKDLSKHQKQLNTLKENALNTIDEINKKEEKTEEDIIKQYKTAVKLKKVLEEMEQTKVDISKIIGKDNYDETSKITVPKSIIPNKDKNISAKDAVDKYIEGYKLESKLKQVYNRGLKQKEAKKTKYLEDKEIKENTKLYENAEKNQKEVAKKLEDTNKELANQAKEFDEQIKKLEQDTVTSVMEYMKVADKTSEKSLDSMKKAFKDLATYINSGGDLNNISEGLEKLLEGNSDLGNKNSDLFKERIKELQDILAGKKSLQDVVDYHYNKGDLLFKIDTDKQTDTDLENIKKKQKELEKSRKLYEENAKAREKAINSNATGETDDVSSDRIQGDIPVSIIPEVEPEEFVSKITEQLKGHPAKVDVELNSENIAEEVKKITEMIPDKKEIEVSVNLEDIDKKIIENVGIGEVSATPTASEEETVSISTNNSIDNLIEDLQTIYKLIDKIQEEEIFSPDFIASASPYTEKDLQRLIDLFKELDKVTTGKSGDYSDFSENYFGKYFNSSFISEALDGAKPESEDWNIYMSDLLFDQQRAINSLFHGIDAEGNPYSNLLDEVSPEIKSKLEEAFTLNPEALRKHFEDYRGIIKNVLDDGFYDLEDRFYSEQNTQTDKPVIETKDENKIPVKVKPEFDEDEFIQDIASKLKGKEVPIDVIPSENSEKFLDRLSTYSEKMDGIKEVPETKSSLEDNKQYDNSEEIASMSKLKQEVDKVTTSVDEKTNAFQEEEQVVTGEVIPREISELERLSGELVSVRDDIEKITSAITTLPKIDFDVDMSKLNIENIDGAAIASFNTFREQLAGLEAQLNVSNLSEKLLHISEAFERLSRIENLENLNTKNLNVTPIVQLAEKAGSITELVEALSRLKECLDGLKAASFDSDYFNGLKLTKANVNNMAEMAVALETVGIALQSFDKGAKESLSSINQLLERSEALKDISSFVKNSGKESVVSIDSNDNIVLEDILPSDKQFKNAISDLDMVETKMMDIVKITKKSKKDSNGNFIEDYVVNYGNGSSETYRKDANSNKARLFNSSYVKFDAKSEEKTMLEVQKQITKEIDEQTADQQKRWRSFVAEIEVQEQITKEIEKQTEAQQKKWQSFVSEQNSYISSQQEAEAKDRNIKANQELIDTIQKYSDIKKRIAKDDMFDGDVEKAEILEQKISELQKQPILHTSQIEASERSLQKLYDTLDTIERKTQKAKETKVTETVKAPSTADVNKSTSISDNISNGTYKKSVDEVTARFSKLNGEVKYNEELVKQLASAYDKLKSADGVENKIQAYKEFEKALASAKNELSGLEQKSNGLNFADKIEKQFEAIANEYKDLSYLSSSLEELRKELTRIQNEAKESGADLTKLGQEARQAFAVFNKGVLPSGDIMGSFGNLNEAIAKAKEVVNGYDKVKTELKTPLQVNDNGIAKMTAQVVDLNGELKTLTFVYNDVTKTMVKQTTNIRKELSGIPGVVDAVKSKLKDMAVYWTATMFDPMDILYKMREIADVVVDLNTQMTELAKVSNLSIDQLEGRFNDWAKTAKDLGATISDTISASADWSRLGYPVDDAERLAEVSILYKNVGDGIDINQANESLVSTMQGFQMEASQAESIIDSFNEVSNNFAITSGGIGEALQRSAASFYAANTDLNSAIALITATNSVIQDPTRVGNMWKTVSMRIRGATTELEEAGLETDGMLQSTSQLRDLIKQMTGFDIMKNDKSFKNMKDIIIGIGKEWKNLSDIDQAALLEKLAGKTQGNALAAALNNYKMIEKAFKTAEGSAGSARREQEAWEKSLEANINKLKASAEELAYTFVDSGALNFLIDIGKIGVESLDALIDKFGSLETVVGALGAILSFKNIGKICKCICFNVLNMPLMPETLFKGRSVLV